MKKEKSAAIVLAAGQGKRMNSKIQKQYLLLKGKPVLYYSLKAMEESFIDEVVLVVGAGEEEYVKQEIVQPGGFHKVKKIVTGGKERYHSVANGIRTVSEDTDYLYIHDGARPFLEKEILERARTCVHQYKACVVGMHVKDTIKIADDNGFGTLTPDRSRVWMIQTPQVFDFSLIKTCYEKLTAQEEELIKQGIKITDDAMVVETFSAVPVKFTEGSYKNIKITTPEDMKIAELFLDGAAEN